jgi:alpha-L-rhamnosidase
VRITRRRLLVSTAAVALSHRLIRSAAAWGLVSKRRAEARLSDAVSPIAEPYPHLHGGSFSGERISASPDPLVRYRWDYTKADDELQTYQLAPVATWTEAPTSFKTKEPKDGGPIQVEGKGSIRFDFGVVSAAWLEFDSTDCVGSVAMSISEYDEPAVVNSGPPHPAKTLAPKRYGDTYRLELNPEMYEGVRFGWIHVRSFERPWSIKSVRLVCQVKPTNYLGSFDCSDSELNRIWYTGAYSVKANLCKDYFGALLMDRGDRYSWTGDAHPSQAAAMVAFGNYDFIRDNLERSAGTNNGIESYSIYWVLSLVEYYLYSGDRPTLERHINRAAGVLDHAASIYNDPPITFYGWDERLGAGFEAPDCQETKSAYRMLFIQASIAFADVLESVGLEDLSASCRSWALKKMSDLRTEREWYASMGLHALADAINTGQATDGEVEAIFKQCFTDRLQRLSFSPFNQSFVLQAMARMGRYDEAFITALDHWGGQIAYGGTTFFETYTPSWNACAGKNGALPNGQSGYVSLAHAWGAGVTAWLTREVLGIRPTAPGFSKVSITPHLGSRLSHVSGSVPTPLGAIHFSFDRTVGRCAVTLPEGSTARIGLPTFSGSIQRVLLGGHLVWDGSYHPLDSAKGASLGSDFLYLEDVQSGHHEFTVSYRATKTARKDDVPLVYPITKVMEDDRTQGDWGRAHGKDGYVLFNYDGVRKDRKQLPTYIRSVEPSTRKIGGCLHAQVIQSATDHRLPMAARDDAGLRNLGQLYTGDPVACQQTMTIDVDSAAGQRYQVALYFLDWDKQERRQAVELFDLESLNRLAPVKMVNDFTQGKYLVYECHGPVRFRINQVRGKNAVLNAMYFDTLG